MFGEIFQKKPKKYTPLIPFSVTKPITTQLDAQRLNHDEIKAPASTHQLLFLYMELAILRWMI
jgi:hypothetical protein